MIIIKKIKRCEICNCITMPDARSCPKCGYSFSIKSDTSNINNDFENNDTFLPKMDNPKLLKELYII